MRTESRCASVESESVLRNSCGPIRACLGAADADAATVGEDCELSDGSSDSFGYFFGSFCARVLLNSC